MCGICGYWDKEKVNESRVRSMNAALVHRGPDEEGYFFDASIGLGQRRLSIIDLAGGQQPIANEDKTLYLICNGEIYNSPRLRRQLISQKHTFKTSTDVEVILHLYEEYGKECVKQLRGMFAFALWDRRRQTLLLARDHLGQKPLFFYQKDNVFIFASEIKAILASGLVKPEIDLNGLWHYVSLRYIPDCYSLFKRIHKLPAASLLCLKGGEVAVEKYWSLDFKEKQKGAEEDIVEGLNDTLLETVKMHLLSDVRVGAFLSGGIDSSLVCAMMAKATGEKIPSFSIGVKEEGFNELPYSRMVAARYGLEAHEQVVNADLIHLLPEMVYHMDEPSDPFGVGIYLVAGLARKTVKVALGGDGGDENFAGYDRFAGNRMVDYYCLLPQQLRQGLMKKAIARIPESFGYKSLAQKAAWLNEMSLFSGGKRYAQSLSFLRFTQQAKEELFTAQSKAQIDDYDSYAKILTFFDAGNADDLIDKMLYTDLMTRMPDHLLVLVDRMTMAHSLENRSPLIDYKVVEYAAGIPAHLKLKGKTLKYILRKLAKRYLPDELIYRKKQGFGFPIGMWMRTELKNFLTNLMRDSRFVALGVFEAGYIQRLLNEHLSGKADHNYRLWILMNLEIWYRIYFERETVESMKAIIDALRGKEDRDAAEISKH